MANCHGLQSHCLWPGIPEQAWTVVCSCPQGATGPQAGGANPLQKLGGGSGRSWQTIRPDGTVENRAIIIPALLTLRADATCQTATADRTTVDIRTVYIEIGPLK